jgi:hypothetical protein
MPPKTGSSVADYLMKSSPGFLTFPEQPGVSYWLTPLIWLLCPVGTLHVSHVRCQGSMSVSPQHYPVHGPASLRPPSLQQVECQGVEVVLILPQVQLGRDAIGFLYH